jgi:hypothetical protein
MCRERLQKLTKENLMGVINEKAMPFIMTAIQAVTEVKKGLEARVQSMIKEAMSRYDSEFSEMKSRLSRLEGMLDGWRGEPAEKPARSKKARKRKNAGGSATCTFPGCTAKHMAKGLCKNHYYKFKRGTVVKTEGGYAAAGDAKPEEKPA